MINYVRRYDYRGARRARYAPISHARLLVLLSMVATGGIAR